MTKVRADNNPVRPTADRRCGLAIVGVGHRPAHVERRADGSLIRSRETGDLQVRDLHLGNEQGIRRFRKVGSYVVGFQHGTRGVGSDKDVVFPFQRIRYNASPAAVVELATLEDAGMFYLGHQHIVAITNPDSGERDFAERDSMPAELTNRPNLTMDDPWGIYYTGGTTGLPKGAVLTHGNVTWNSVNTISSWGINGQHKAALQLPFFHIGGPNIFMVPLVHAGGTTILCSGFNADETFDLIEHAGITHYVAVPTMFQVLQEHSRWTKTDFSKLELIISGGAPCPLPIMQKFWDRGVDFKMGYGLTEASGNNFWLPPELVQKKIGSVGYPIFHIDMKIIRDDGTQCAANEEGELLIRGPHVVAGYWKNPQATADTIRDGWLHTGDVAKCDTDGCYSILGRSKEMFISGGENVYPAEIESVLSAHPAVKEAAVVGVPHPTWGEVGRAFVVVSDDYEEQDLRTFLAARLAKYKLPRAIVVLEALPLTAIGKLDKKGLVSLEAQGC